MIAINPPPKDMCCQLCHRHIDELKAFGGSGDPLVGDFTGQKLVKGWGEEYPGYTRASWECRDCFVRPGGLWELFEEDKLGRPLSAMERHGLRFECLVGLWRMMLDRELTDDEKGELRYLLDDWRPEDLSPEEALKGSVEVTLTDEDMAEVMRQAERRRPAERHEV